MSDHSRWWFVGLLGVPLLAGLGAGGIYLGASGVVRIALAVPLFLLFPGYAFVSVLFPDDATEDRPEFDDDRTGLWSPAVGTDGIGRLTRFVLSVVTSIAFVAVVALAATVTPWGITLRPLLGGIVALTAGFSLFGLIRRWRCPPDRRFSPALGTLVAAPFYAPPRTPFGDSNHRAYNVGIVLALALLVASAGFALANPPQGEGFTELYADAAPVDGDDESMYRSTYVRGETEEFAVNVANHEGEATRYTTVVELQRTDGNATTDVAELARGEVTVADGATERRAFEVTPTTSGDDLQIVVLLYEGDAPADPSAEGAYRTLRLPVTVEERSGALTGPDTDATAATGGR